MHQELPGPTTRDSASRRWRLSLRGRIGAGAGPSAVSIQTDEPLRVELLATMNGDGYVVLADTIYPGWRATVDGAEAPIFAANGLFRAVVVSDGSHRVRFEYRPRSLLIGAAITAVAAALAVGLVLASRARAS